MGGMNPLKAAFKGKNRGAEFRGRVTGRGEMYSSWAGRIANIPSLPSRSTLPPQLLLETLYTIYLVLFPLSEKKAARMARRLVSHSERKYKFDPDLQNFGTLDYGIPIQEFKYLYWAQRLRSLHAIVTARPPANRVTSLFERYTSERNALVVAIVGLFLSVFFG